MTWNCSCAENVSRLWNNPTLITTLKKTNITNCVANITLTFSNVLLRVKKLKKKYHPAWKYRNFPLVMVVKYSLWFIWLSYWVWAQVSCKAQWVVTPSHRTGVKILQKSWTPWNETYNRCLDVWVVLIPFSFRQLQKKYHSQATGQVHWKCLKWFVSNYVWGCVLYLPGNVIISSAVLQCHAEPQYTCKKKQRKLLATHW